MTNKEFCYINFVPRTEPSCFGCRLIFISISGLIVDVYNIMWLIVIAHLWKWPVKILVKISSKLCVIFYNFHA